jgi:hypothetical protein
MGIIGGIILDNLSMFQTVQDICPADSPFHKAFCPVD